MRSGGSVVVVGLGTVGLPTAALLTCAGMRVVGVDSSANRRDAIFSGGAQAGDHDLAILLKEALTSGLGIAEDVIRSDSYVVCVQTPVDGSGSPDLGALDSALDSVGRAMAPGALVIVESTLPPGGSARAVALLEKACGSPRGAGFDFAYAPERVLPGNVVAEIRGNARIVGTHTAEAAGRAESLLRNYVTGPIHHTDPATAEIVKLAENAYRMVNIGFANELAGLCESLGADAREVVRLANLHPRVRILDPGPGVAGPCLPKDPLLLAHSRERSSSLILAALAANSAARERMLGSLRSALAEAGHSLKGARVLVLGIAYKGGVGDTTDSAGLWLAARLKDEGAVPVLADPRARPKSLEVAADLYAAAQGCAAAVICTEHPEYRTLDLGRLGAAMAPRPVLVDARGLVPSAPGFVFRSLGRTPER
jgi:UDP-N-acetyl-D-mannosaminuronic acid dehydrogenase